MLSDVLLLLLVSAVASQIEIQTGRRLYTGYQVVRTYPEGQDQRAALLTLDQEVDFWSDIGPHSTQADLMVAPDRQEVIKAYLQANGIPFQVLIPNVQREIDNENNEEDDAISVEQLDNLIHLLPENPRDKRQGADLFSLLGLPNLLVSQNTRRRRRPQDAGPRRPRKFSSSSIPAINAPVSSFPKSEKNGTSEICSVTGMNWKQYQSVHTIYSWMDCLEANFKQKVQLITIGKSSEGRPLRVARVRIGEEKKQAIFIDGGIHAREWASPASVTYILHKLVETGDLDALLQVYDAYILPAANPDGYEYSRNHDRMWRKTRSKTGVRNILGQECFGVDPNRNFGWRWGGHGASKNQCKETYMGPAPFSEPETRAIKNFLSSGKNFKLYLTFHSYGQYILYPWGFDDIDAVDKQDLHRVGTRAANVLKSRYGSSYQVGSAAQLLYPASGGSDDWAKGGAGIKYSFTVELPDTGTHGFILPARFIQGVGREAVTCLETMVNNI